MARTTTNSPAKPAPGDHVLTLCHMLANRIGKAFTSDLEAEGVTVAEWRVLLTLASREKACGQEITAGWAMDKMAVNRAIASLKRKRLVQTRENAEDRRVVDLTLTESGRGLFAKLLPVANERYRKLLSGLEKSEEVTLRRILRKLIVHVDTVTD